MEREAEDVVAERMLRHGGSTVRVLLGRPTPMPDGTGFRCPCRIEGLATGDAEFAAAGITPSRRSSSRSL
jgi:hypothetical protein